MKGLAMDESVSDIVNQYKNGEITVVVALLKLIALGLTAATAKKLLGK